MFPDWARFYAPFVAVYCCKIILLPAGGPEIEHHAIATSMGVASNEAEEAGASSLFCVRMHDHIGDVL